MWKRKKYPTDTVPLGPVIYPAGVAVRTSKGSYLINKDGKRYRILTKKVLDSWNFPIVVITTELALSNYPVAVTKLGFRDGTLLNNIADGKLYLVSANTLRHVTSPDVLDRLNLSRNDAIVVSNAEINIMKFGEEIY